MKRNKSTVNTILEIAFGEVGYVEKPVNITKYGKAFGMNPAQWCGLFLMWVFRQAKRDFPNTAYTPNGVNAWKRRDQWHEEGDPKSGDIVYFDFPDSIDRVQHVGICVKTMEAGKSVLCIEGNTSGNDSGSQSNGGEVAIKLRKREHIVGWGRPKYRDGESPIISKIVAEYDKPFKKKAKKNEEAITRDESKLGESVPSCGISSTNGGSDGLECSPECGTDCPNSRGD
jgi:hypothetical protein